jgi:deoxyribodipyrimidine photo-lyase
MQGIALEYELDEVRRDLRILELAKDWNVYCDFYEDKLIVPPYKVSTQQGKQFSVSSTHSWTKICLS